VTLVRRIANPSYSRRRGVTLIEMLVTVAVLVIIMTILVQVFQAATGAMSTVQALQQIDDQFRRVDGLLRSDLEGVTARFTPPLDPALNQGYFEYGENEFADVQGEDSDDYVRFTAKAPEGKPFTGRMWVTGAGGPLVNGNVQPVTITSEFAEIIYFLRNGNLYRRVILVAPQLQPTIAQVIGNQIPVAGANPANAFYPVPVFNPQGTQVINASWQGLNDLSARPAARGAPFNMTNGATNTLSAINTIQLNTLGDLTNRENRFAMPRFADDFLTIGFAGGAITYTANPDGLADDVNNDNIPDLFPSLYPGAFAAATQVLFPPPFTGGTTTTGLNYIANNATGINFLGFPFVFPGAYSVPQVLSNSAFGWIHSPSPFANVPQDNANCQAMKFEDNPVAYLQSMNHNPLDIGDNLPTPTTPLVNLGKIASTQLNQTWWGFPTWRETLSPSWNDPGRQVNDKINFGNFGQPAGLTLVPANNVVPTGNVGVTDIGNADLLPPMAIPATWPATGDDFSLIRRTSQPFSDGVGGWSAFMGGQTVSQYGMWSLSWEDDLIMTGVRSFDIKAYDNSLATYVDLGWGDDFRIPQQATATTYGNATIAQAPYLNGNYDEVTQAYLAPAFKFAAGGTWNLLTQTFAHEGRTPPLILDNVLDAQYPNPYYTSTAAVVQSLPLPLPGAGGGYLQQYPNISDGTNVVSLAGYSSNIGDNNAGIVRLRRVWDSWSTEYTKAPANGIYNNPGVVDPLNNSPWGPNANTPPIYPSYPPPYPAPLRGIQIQIRAVDPTNQRIKSLTIRQDFTDKL
jgi:prepilin-type N-terminal cleavage/methylation domain-containing protein